MKNFLCVVSCCLVLLSNAQSEITFDIVDHDFGEIKEEDGYAEHTFNFVNTGDAPVKIINVKASCGCTTPGWTKEELIPGDSGFVKARYNPRNRPGRFRKSLRITTSDPEANQTLYIMGMVKPKPKSPEEEFPVAIGKFRMKYQGLNIGKVTTEKPVEKSFDIYNSSDSTASLEVSSMVLPDHITASLSPEFLNPREFGKLVITYDPIKKNDYGFVSDNILLDTASDRSLSVITIIEEYFPEMTAEELDEAPKLEISDRTFDFGQVNEGSVVETSFELNNVGKEKLEIRAIKSNCDCVTYKSKSKRIKKGKNLTLDVKFDTSEMRGNQYKSISIYSNDPVRPTQVINLNGKVEK